MGKRTSTRSLAGTVTRTPAGTSAPRLADSTTTSASSGASRVVLDDDRQLDAVAEVQEARCGRSDHQRQLGGDVGLAGAELLGTGRRRRPSRGSG